MTVETRRYRSDGLALCPHLPQASMLPGLARIHSYLRNRSGVFLNLLTRGIFEAVTVNPDFG